MKVAINFLKTNDQGTWYQTLTFLVKVTGTSLGAPALLRDRGGVDYFQKWTEWWTEHGKGFVPLSQEEGETAVRKWWKEGGRLKK